MSVRAKFIVQSVTHHEGESKIVKLRPVGPDDKDGIAAGERFHKYTPCGSIELTIDNPPASEQFAPGGAFYVDFTPVPKAS